MVDLKDLCEKLNNENAQLEEQLLRYKSFGFIPKLHISDKGYTVDTKENKVIEFSVDEIFVNKLGIFYKEYLSETDLRIVPDTFCFTSEQEATKFLEEQNNSVV